MNVAFFHTYFLKEAVSAAATATEEEKKDNP